MSNDFYNHGSFPTTGSAATSASMRAELDSIAAGFDKMPTLTANANEIVVVNSSATGLDSIATLPAGSGGTGFASYAVGDLLYASTTTALSKLADVATGNALISGGVGVAPSYGKIGLTTHVSGTLPVANGGTGLTAGTSGGVLYYSATGTLASSAALAASALVVGGGAGAAPATVTTGTGVVTALGVNVGTAGAFVVNGGALGTPSSGTVTNLTGTASININGTVGATTPAAGTFTALTVNTSGVISVNTSSDALRITQVGSGNALLVEDSTNPDSTPFVVKADGSVIVGYTTSVTGTGPTTATSPVAQVHGTTNNTSSIGLYNWSSTGSLVDTLSFNRSLSNTIGTFGGAVTSGVDLGAVSFSGDDGTSFIEGARIFAEVDGTPGTNDMPGRLVFSTTADGASVPTERMRIDSAGRVGINATALTGYQVRIAGTYASSDTNPIWLAINGTIPSTATGQAYGFFSGSATQAAAFTLTGLNHFFASQGGVGAGSTLTNQYGFRASSNLIDATNNYGFYSDIPAAANRYNFYANGTADNFFGGDVIVDVSTTDSALRVTQRGAGNALLIEDSTNPDSTPFVIDTNGRAIFGNTVSTTYSSSLTIIPAVQVNAAGAATSGISRFSANTASNGFWLLKSRGTTIGDFSVVASGDSLGTIGWLGADGADGIQAATITAAVDGTPGTNDMPGRLVFSTTADGASTPTERVRIDSAGNVLVGGTAVRGTTVGAAHLDIFNGTAPAGTLTNGISLYSASGDFNFMDATGSGYKVGYRNVPPVGTKTGSYTLALADVGEYVQVGSGGSITIPDATFAEGDAVSIFNNTTGNVTITCTITTAYIAGTDLDKATVTLATRGVATVLFISGTVCVITGNVS
jgi:hypothetical protein